MKYVKMLGLLAVAAAAMLAFVANASATIITSPANTKLGVGTEIEASSEGATTLDGLAKITCNKSTVKGKVENAGGPETGETVSGKIEELTFEECNQHVTVLNKGSLEVHTQYKTITDENGTKTWVCCEANNSNGTLTSTGAEVTVQITSLGLSCLFKTNETDIGNLTGSKNTGATATLDIDSSPIPRTGHSVFCGSSSEWTGSYKVNTPDYLDVD